MIFYQSEVARLVLDYLQKEECWLSAEIFLKESPHLEEHRNLSKTGKLHPLTVNGKSLKDYLELYCEEDLRGNTEKSHVLDRSENIVEVGEQIESLSSGYVEETYFVHAHDGKDIKIAVDESSDQESIHDVLLSPNKDYINCPFEASSSESSTEQQPSILVLKITDDFTISDETIDNEAFSEVSSQNNIAVQRRKSWYGSTNDVSYILSNMTNLVSSRLWQFRIWDGQNLDHFTIMNFQPRKLLTVSLVSKELDKYERYWTLDLLQKDMVFVDQLLFGHPVVQKLAYIINNVKENVLREDKNLPISKKDTMYFEEIVKETIAKIESNTSLHKYFVFLCYQRDSYMSLKKSRCLNFEHVKKLSTVSSKALEASCLNFEEYVAENSPIMPHEIILNTISAAEDIPILHLNNLYHPVVPNVTKNQMLQNVTEEENVNYRTLVPCSSTSNFTVRNNCNRNDPLSVQFDTSESNDSALQNKNTLYTTSELNRKCPAIPGVLNCTKSDVNTANDKMTIPLECCVDSTLNNTNSNMDSVHDGTTISSRYFTNSSAPITTNSYVRVANDEISNFKCDTNSNISNGINSDVVITDNQTTRFSESYTNITNPKGMNSDVDNAGDQIIALSSSKDCAHLSSTTFDYMVNHETDEEDIPLFELRNQIRLKQSSHLNASLTKECTHDSHTVSDIAGIEEDMLSAFQHRKTLTRKPSKKISKLSGFEKVHGKFAHTRSYEFCFNSEGFLPISNILGDKYNSTKEANKSDDAPISSNYSTILNSFLFSETKKCANQEIPTQVKNVCTVASESEHLSCAGDGSCALNINLGSSVISSLKNASKVQNNINLVSSDASQTNDSSGEIIDNDHIFFSQTDNSCFKKTKDNHSVSKCEIISDLDQNIRLFKSKRKKHSSKETSKGKLFKMSLKEENSSHSDLVNLRSVDKLNKEMSSDFLVEPENLCTITSFPEHMNNLCGEISEGGDSTVPLLPKEPPKVKNSLNSITRESLQSDDSSTETLDNKQSFLSQTGKNCFKLANDNYAVSRECETTGNSFKNIKSSETKMRKNSLNETLLRRLPKRLKKQTEKISHSDLSDLKTNNKTSLEVSNVLVETENLKTNSFLPEPLSSCVKTKVVAYNSSSVPLLMKDEAQFQCTLHPLSAELFESDNSPPERLANTNEFLDLADNKSCQQKNNCHAISEKSVTISNLDQNVKSSKRKRKNPLKETSKERLPKKSTKQEKKPSYSELIKLKTNEKCRVENLSDFSVEMENLHSDPSLHAGLSSLCMETQEEIKKSSRHLLVKAPTELQNSLIPVTSDAFPSDDSSVETLDDINAFLSSTNSKHNYDISRECKETICDKIESQNIESSELKVLGKHSRKQSNPKKVTSLKQMKHKLKKESRKETNPKCKFKEAKTSVMLETYQALNSIAFTSSSTKKISGKETLDKDLLKCTALKKVNAIGYALGVKKSQKMCKSKKQKSVEVKLCKSSKEPLSSKQKTNIKTLDDINDIRNNLNSINDQNNSDLEEKHDRTTSLDKRVTLDTAHKDMVLIPVKKRMLFDYLKHEYLESFNNFLQTMFLLISYVKEIDHFYFEIKKILLFKFISQKNQTDDLLAKYLDGKLHIKNLKAKSSSLKSAFSEGSDKLLSIDIFKQFCHKTVAIQQKFERRFKFGMKMCHEKMQIKKNNIIKYVDLQLLYLELLSIKESLMKKSSISKEKVYSFKDPAFSLGSELFSQQPIVLLERSNIPFIVRNTVDDTELQSFERTLSFKNTVSSSMNESQKPFLASLLNDGGSALKEPSRLTIMSNLISFNGGNAWSDEFKNVIITMFETTMDTALFVNNILYNICEYSCDISKFVLGNNFSNQNMPYNLLVDSSKKKNNSLDEFSLLDERIVSSADDLTNENDVGQNHSPLKRQRVSLEDLSFTDQISKALGAPKDSTVDNSQNSLRTGEISDPLNEISPFCFVKSEAKKKSCKSIERSDFHPKEDSCNIQNKSPIHKKTKQNNKEITALEISKKLKSSNKLNPSNPKKQQDSRVMEKKNLNSFRKSRKKFLLNSFQDAHILPESKKFEKCVSPMNMDKKCYLTPQEAVDNELFSTMSDSLNDSSSNTCIYWPTSTDEENLGFKESTNPKELHTKSKGICAGFKKSTKQIKIADNSISEFACMNSDQGEYNLNDNIRVSSINEKCKKQALNSFEENENSCIILEHAETGGKTNIGARNVITETDHTQNISQKSCMWSSKKSKGKREVVSLCKRSLKKVKLEPVLKSKSQGLPRKSSTSTPVSNLNLSIFHNVDEFLAALGEKSVTEKKRKSAKFVMNCILEMGIEGFLKSLPAA